MNFFVDKKMKGSGIIIENSKQEILLFLRDNKKTIPYPGQWDILGGTVEKDESFEQAIKRELMEEIELDLKDFELFKIYKWPNSKEAVFYAKLDIDINKINLHEGQKLKYFTKKELLAENLAFYGNKIVRDFLKAKTEN